MNGLERLPNIGKMLASELNGAGNETATDLGERGSVRAAHRFVKDGRLRLLEQSLRTGGGIRGVRWHVIPRHEKDELRARFGQALRDESE